MPTEGAKWNTCFLQQHACLHVKNFPLSVNAQEELQCRKHVVLYSTGTLHCVAWEKVRSRTPNFCLSDLMPSIYQSILLTTAPSKNPAYHCTNKASCLPWQQQSILLTIAPSEYHHWSIPLAIALTNWNTHMYFGCQTYNFYYNDDSILCFCNMDLFY